MPNFSTFAQEASTEVHKSPSVAGGLLQVLECPLLVLRFTSWQGWPVGVSQLGREPWWRQQAAKLLPRRDSVPENRFLRDLFSGCVLQALADFGQVPSSFCALVSLVYKKNGDNNSKSDWIGL